MNGVRVSRHAPEKWPSKSDKGYSIINYYNSVESFFPIFLYRYRDSFDELSKTVRTLAEEDEINESLNEGLKQFSNAVTNLGDHMDLQVNRMELKVRRMKTGGEIEVYHYPPHYRRSSMRLPCSKDSARAPETI